MATDKEFYEIVCKDRFTSIEQRIDNMDSKFDTKLDAISNKLDAKIAPLSAFRFKSLGATAVIVILFPLLISVGASWGMYAYYEAKHNVVKGK
jgi:hypothetical protein